MNDKTPEVHEALAVYAPETSEAERVPPGYKQTEVGVIPEDWEVKSLSELCYQIVDGTHYTPKYVANGIPFYSVENVTANDFENTRYISPEAHAILAKRCKPERGDILLTRIGSLGDTKLIEWDVEASIYVSLALLKVGDGVDAAYLYRYSNFRRFVIEVEKRSLLNATPKKINMGDIGNVEIPLPPTLEEQRAIAASLSDVDDLISALDRLIAKKRAVKTAAMQQLLTGKQRLPGFSGEWEVKRLGDVAHINMGQSPSSRNYNVRGIGLPLIQGNADIEDRKTIARVWTTQVTKSCDEGDVVVTVRAPVGYVGVASTHSCLGRGVCSVKPTDIEQQYLFHALVNAESEWKMLEQGSTFTSANSDQISKFRVMRPKSSDEQTAIAAVLSDMDAEVAALEGRREKTRRIKQGMMQELLTGRTRLV